MRSLTAFVFLFFLSLDCLAAAIMTYHGRLMDPAGVPVESPTVDFTVRIYSPVSKCLLYQETSTISLLNSRGIFALPIGGGTRTGADPHLTLDKVFQNDGVEINTTTNPGLTCVSGSSYTPTSMQKRLMVVQFDDHSGSGLQTLPEMEVTYVPLALNADNAQNIGGTPANSVLRVSGGPAVPLTPAYFTELMNLITGVSTQYTRVGYLGSSPLPTLTNGQVLGWNAGTWVGVDPASVDASSITGLDAEIDARITAQKNAAGGLAGLNAGGLIDANQLGSGTANGSTYLSGDGTWKTISSGGTDNTKLPLLGGTMEGSIDMDNNDITGARNISVATISTHSVLLSGTVPSSPVEGAVWYESGVLKYRDASATQTLSAGASNATQLQSRDVASTAPLDGQLLSWDEDSGAWRPAHVGLADLKTPTGDPQFLVCPAGQVVSWSAITDATACVDITVNGGSFANQAANKVFAGPGSGADASPSFRSLVSDDIPSLSTAKITGLGSLATVSSVDLATQATGILPLANGGTGASTADGALTNLGLTSTGLALAKAADAAAARTAIGAMGAVAAGTSGNILRSNGSTWASATLTAADFLPSQSGQGGKFLTTNGSAASWSTVAATPGGSSGQLQYNNGGTLDGAGVSWNSSDTQLNIGGSVKASLGSSSSLTINWNTANIQTTTAAAGTLVLNNMQDGANHTLILTQAGTFTLTGSSVTAWKCAPACTDGEITVSGETVLTILKVGSKAYVSWITGF